MLERFYIIPIAARRAPHSRLPLLPKRWERR